MGEWDVDGASRLIARAFDGLARRAVDPGGKLAGRDLVREPSHLSTLPIMVIALPQSGVERREFLRLEVRLENLEVTVGVFGFEATKGVVINVSRGGLKVALSREISQRSDGYDCLVRFVDQEDRIKPEVKVGKLRRTEAAAEYAIEFDSPLGLLNVVSDPETVESGSGATSDADG